MRFLSDSERWLMAVFFGGIFITGGAWLLVNLYIYYHDNSSVEALLSVRAKILIAHGTLAPFVIFFFGIIWEKHAKKMISSLRKRKKKKPSGLALFTTLITMILSGVVLYYAPDDAIRGASSVTHWVAGLVFFVAAVCHIPWTRLKVEKNKS